MTDSSKNPFLSVTTKQLGMERFYHMFRIPESELGEFAKSSYRVDTDYDVDFAMMRLRLETTILKEPLGRESITRTGEIQVPATWWQHYKETMSDDIVARWIRRRWPVQYKIERKTFHFIVEHAAIYPEANIAMPALGRPIPYHVLKEI